MKKINIFFVWIAIAIAFFSFSSVLVSCGGGEDEDGTEINNGNNNNNNNNNNGGDSGGDVVNEEMSPIEQKEFMEKVALNFLNEFNAKDFKGITNLVEYISDEYSDYDSEIIDEWFEDYLDEITKFTGSSSESYGYNYIEHYKNYTQLFVLSNLTGKFTAVDGEWVYEKAGNLQFVVEDQYGKDCVATLTTGGNIKKVYVGKDTEWNDWYSIYDDSIHKYVYHEYYDCYERTIAVPERMELVFKQDSKTLVKVVVNVDLSSMRGEEFDLSKDAYSMSVNTFVNDYEFSLKRLAYAAGKNSGVSFVVKHNNTELVSMEVAADVEVADEDVDACKNVDVAISIMGDIQIKGKCKDVVCLVEYMEDADDNDDNEGMFKSYLNMANSLLDLGVYYKGKSYRYADVKLEPAVDKNYYYESWYYDCVFYFNEDKTTYTLLEVFFNDKDFASLINRFEDLMEDFADLVE